MARTTTNYGYNISEGPDPVNPLVDIFPNWDAIDGDLKDVSDAALTTATELLTGTVHALTRADGDRSMMAFVATSNYTAGETFTVDGTQVTALTPDGQTLATGSYIIGSAVLGILNGTLLTVYVNPAKAKDSDKLDGEDSTYYATAGDLITLDVTVGNISDKVGTGVLQTTAQDCVGAINEVNSNLTNLANIEVVEAHLDLASQSVAPNTLVQQEFSDGGMSGYTNIGYIVDVDDAVIATVCKYANSRLFVNLYNPSATTVSIKAHVIALYKKA